MSDRYMKDSRGRRYGNRGGGRGYGGRGSGGRGSGQRSFGFEQQDNRYNGDRTPRPAGLRGKDIGLFYRDRQRNANKDNIPTLELSIERRVKIRKLLDDLGDDQLFDQATDRGREFKEVYSDIVNVSFEEKLEKTLQTKSASRNTEKLNETLKENFMYKIKDPKYQKMLDFRKKLPTYQMKDDILKKVKENQAVVISGETGCGKTTQVGQLILEEAYMEGKGSEISIIITQPRRLATTSVASRIASEQIERLGNSIGYTIRLESNAPRGYGCIEVVTAGVVLQRMQSDPALSKVSHLIIDEVHERDSTCDMLMAVVKKVMVKRPDLKVILMSATMDADRFGQYFFGCPLLHIPGLMFPVEEFYLENVLEVTRFKNFKEPNQRNQSAPRHMRHTQRFKEEANKSEEFEKMMEPYCRAMKAARKFDDWILDSLMNPESEELNLELIADLVHYLARGPPGAILVFLPGYSDISTLYDLLEKGRPMPPSRILPLHSQLNSMDQNAIFDRPPSGVRKIILATNIAETSITIDDIVYVIDGGKIKQTNYDADQDIGTLKPEWVSQANAHQRRGRAGRVQAGQCWKLYSRPRAESLEPRPAPSILRAPLHEPLLNAMLLRLTPVRDFLLTLLDPPLANAIDSAITLLNRMDILDESEKLTPLGVHVAKLSVSPGAARMLVLASLMSAFEPACAVAAVMAFKDPFHLVLGKEKLVDECRRYFANDQGSDQLATVEAQKQWGDLHPRDQRKFCFDYFLNHKTLEMLKDMRLQFGRLLYSAKFTQSQDPGHIDSNRNSDNDSLVKALIVAGLYPNVATYKGGRRNRKFETAEDRNVFVHPGSVNSYGDDIAPRLVYRMKQLSTKLYLHDTSPAHAIPLLFFGDKFAVTETNTGIVISCGGGKWRCEKPTAIIIERLRNALKNLLKFKIENPAPIDWKSPEGQVLKAIIELITAEDNSRPDYNFDSD